EGTTDGRSRNSAVPSGLIVSIPPHPRLKPWAILRCPSGTTGTRPCWSKLSSGGGSISSEAWPRTETRISRIDTNLLFLQSRKNLACLHHVLGFKDSSGVESPAFGRRRASR